jgi:hypothetical protein
LITPCDLVTRPLAFELSGLCALFPVETLALASAILALVASGDGNLLGGKGFDAFGKGLDGGTGDGNLLGGKGFDAFGKGLDGGTPELSPACESSESLITTTGQYVSRIYVTSYFARLPRLTIPVQSRYHRTSTR